MSNTKKSFHEHEIEFTGTYAGADPKVFIENKVTDVLRDPVKANAILGDKHYPAYKAFFEHSIGDGEFEINRLSTLEWIADLGEEEDEVVFGFVSPDVLEPELIIEIKNDVIAPLVEKLFEGKMVLSSQVESRKHYNVVEKEVLK